MPSSAIGREQFFFLVQRIGTGDPALGPFPGDPEPTECLAHGLDADWPGHPAETNTLLDEKRERPQAGLEAEIAWRPMQHRFEQLGSHVCSHNGRQVVGTARSGLQGATSLLVERMNGMANRLFVAGEGLRDAGGGFSTSRGQQDLAATEHKGIRGTQPRGKPLLFLFGKGADKNAWFHGSEYTTSQITSLVNALDHGRLA